MIFMLHMKLIFHYSEGGASDVIGIVVAAVVVAPVVAFIIVRSQGPFGYFHRSRYWCHYPRHSGFCRENSEGGASVLFVFLEDGSSAIGRMS